MTVSLWRRGGHGVLIAVSTEGGMCRCVPPTITCLQSRAGGSRDRLSEQGEEKVTHYSVTSLKEIIRADKTICAT